MTFDATETSALGQPVEFLTFTQGATGYRFTNSNFIEQLGARTFEPLSYTRTEPVYSKGSSDGHVEIIVPVDLPLVQLYESPTVQTTTVTIERRHRNDPDQGIQIYWQGVIGSISRNGFEAKILAIPLSGLPAQVPRYSYSGLCNWFLYQDRCGLARQNFRHIGAVSSVVGPVITVTGLRAEAAAIDAGISGALSSAELDDYWLGGYVETVGGERRSIYATNVDMNADRVRVLAPFNVLAVSDNVQVFAGCSRTRDICARKFANHLKHGGFPDIPIVPLFATELPTGGGTPQKKRFFGN